MGYSTIIEELRIKNGRQEAEEFLTDDVSKSVGANGYSPLLTGEFF